MMTSAALLALRRGRTSRSPRISCSPMTARSGVSKPCSRPSTASIGVVCGVGQRLDRSSRSWLPQKARARPAARPAARARPVSRRRREHACLASIEALDVGRDGIEQIAALGRALGGEGAARPAAERAHLAAACAVSAVAAASNGDRRLHLAGRNQPLPLGLGDEHALGRHGLIGRRAEGRRSPAHRRGPRSDRGSGPAGR